MAAQLIPADPAADNLVIPTDACPHCGALRVSAVQRSAGISRSTARYWTVTWSCRSYVILTRPPKLNLSHRCIEGSLSVQDKG